MPEWVDIVKTNVAKELAPFDEDWYYTRLASIARHIYIRSPVGVSTVCKIYGGKKSFHSFKRFSILILFGVTIYMQRKLVTRPIFYPILNSFSIVQSGNKLGILKVDSNLLTYFLIALTVFHPTDIFKFIFQSEEIMVVLPAIGPLDLEPLPGSACKLWNS